MDEKDKTLIYLHIPKTGGTTLTIMISQQYRLRQIHTAYVARPDQVVEDFHRKSRVPLDNIKVFRGHMLFGLHQLLSVPCTYLTILRNPIERVISLYHWILSGDPDHYLHGEVLSKKIGLKEFIAQGLTKEMDNSQTRFISGITAPFGRLPAEALEVAKDNLRDHFALAGLTEQFDEMMVILQKTFGWKQPFYRKVRVAQNRPDAEDISEETMDVIKEYNQLDFALYEYARDLFEQRIQKIPDFRDEVEKYAQLNRFWGGTVPLFQRARTKAMYLLSM